MTAADNDDPTKAPHVGRPKPTGGKAGTGPAPSVPERDENKMRLPGAGQ